MASITENLQTLRARIAAAAERSGRDPESITLVAVSKRFPAEIVNEAIRAGVKEIGENRVQEAEAKFPHLLEGRDLLGVAQTGTGKTAAFALPILQRLIEELTRELEKICTGPAAVLLALAVFLARHRAYK